MKIFCITLVVAIAVLLALECHAESVTLGNKSYYIERNLTVNWFAATQYCAYKDMKLIAIENEAETSALRNYFSPNYFPFWTSGNDLAFPKKDSKSRVFFWGLSAKRVIYANWAPNEPNNHKGPENCIEIYGNSKLEWNDLSCTNALRFICEK